MTRTAAMRFCWPAAIALVFVGVQTARGQDASAASDLDRGKYLAVAGDCVACHTAPGGKPMAGGLPVQTPVGTIISTNITPSRTGGIGGYTLDQFSAAVRDGVRADGRNLYPAMPYTAYARLTDEDIKALYAYFMNGVEPVDERPPETRLPFPFSIRLSMAAWNLLFLDSARYRADPSQSPEWNRGAYLVQGPAHCGTCHTPRNLFMAEVAGKQLAGGEVGFWSASNITSDPVSGIGGWTADELVAYMRDGHAAGKGQAAGPMAEAIDYSLRSLTEADLGAIATYLKTVPAVHDAADSQPVFAWGDPTDNLASIRGTPLPDSPDKMSGPQIYDGYCASCHQARGQGSPDGGLPSLFHNTATGRSTASNLVLVILEGLHRHPDVMMPGFAHEMSDGQVATLANYLTQSYGNPATTVSPDQVRIIRAGPKPSSLVLAAQLGLAAGTLIALAIAFALVRLALRRRSTQAAGRR